MRLHLMSHQLCPYVQRAVIALTEKRVPFERTLIDLADKPDWFLAISPLGKTPVLTVDDRPMFESAAILEYLEETQPNPLHPRDPWERASHRGWMAFGSTILDEIGALYSARDAGAFAAKAASLRARFERLDGALAEGPFFAGAQFCLVDAVFGPVFRYFDTFDRIEDLGIFDGLNRVVSWRRALVERPSIRQAVTDDYPALLWSFLERRGSHLTSLMDARRGRARAPAALQPVASWPQ